MSDGLTRQIVHELRGVLRDLRVQSKHVRYYNRHERAALLYKGDADILVHVPSGYWVVVKEERANE